MISVLRRVGESIFILLALSVIVFTISRVIPGNPARLALGSMATKEAIERLTLEMHLDKPLPIQYYYWFKSALKGDFGDSLWSHDKVVNDIRRTFPATLELVIFSMMLSIVVGQFLGCLSARYHGTWIDNITRLIAYVGIVTPNFALALLLLMVFGFFTGWLPALGRLSSSLTPPAAVTGLYTIDALIALRFDLFLDALKHLLLPGVALAWQSLAQESRITRLNMINKLQSDYILSDKACGFPDRVITFKYALKPSLIPTVSIMGPDLAFMMVNAFLVEKVFDWPGFARYGLETILRKDLNSVIVVVLILGTIFIVTNILVDIVIRLLDPRMGIRKDRGQ